MTKKSDERQVAVITGAASGIGLALAEICIQQDMQVVMVDCHEANLRRESRRLDLLSNSEVCGIVCDVSSLQAVQTLAKETFSRFGRVDFLVNNAGVSGPFVPVWEITCDQIQRLFEINVLGVLHGIQAFMPLLLEQRGRRAHIVNMASVYALCSGSQMAGYGLSKHAVLALTESLYFDLTRLNKPVDVSIVCPSFVNTQLLTHASSSNSSPLHECLQGLMERSRPAKEVAAYIMKEIHKKTFYILPDKEVKHYSEQRIKAIVEGGLPDRHSLEKVVAALSLRAGC